MGGFAACAAVLAAASVAWACEAGIFSATPSISTNPTSVPAGTHQVQVSGRGWVNGVPVELRWGGADGAQIGSGVPGGANGGFITSARIPDVATGNSYRISAVQEGGKVYGLPFRVTAPTSTSTADQDQPLAAGGTTNSVTASDPTPSIDAETGGSAQSTALPVPATGATTASRSPAAVAPAIVGVTQPNPSAGPPASLSRPGVAAAPSAQRPAGRAGPAVAGDEGVRSEATGRAGPARTASGDLWSGFPQGAIGSRSPSLTDLPAAGGNSSNLAVSMGLMGLGVVGLFAGFGVAEVSRRRVLVTRPGG